MEKEKSIITPTVHGIGYLGKGNYKSRVLINGVWEKEKAYQCWGNMLMRCYNQNYQKLHPSYIGFVVCDEWHNFQNFAEWYNQNYYEAKNERMELDKDILIKGNKVYSPNTCIFVPHKINNLINSKVNKKTLIGVRFCIRATNNPYCAIVRDGKKIFFCEYHKTEQDAFYAYKSAKENYIKFVADEYKNIIPKKLYDALYDWEIKITD